MTPRTALERGEGQLGLSLTGECNERLLAYTALLAKWNRSYNLTAVRDPLVMVSHHLLDSLAALPHLPMPATSARIADVGTGAGLPGIPLAVVRSDWQVALIESNQKKAAFLRQAKIELALANVEVHEARVETYRPVEGFALVISRAFAELAEFVAACRHLVSASGVLAAMKGKNPQAEIARLPEGVRVSEVVRLQVPFMDAERHLVLCKLPA